MAELKLISAESVTEGHPDKVCDQISDAILDDMLAQDPHSHVAVETCATVGQFFVFGEVTSEGYSDIQNIVRSVVRNIGYTSVSSRRSAQERRGAASSSGWQDAGDHRIRRR